MEAVILAKKHFSIGTHFRSDSPLPEPAPFSPVFNPPLAGEKKTTQQVVIQVGKLGKTNPHTHLATAGLHLPLLRFTCALSKKQVA